MHPTALNNCQSFFDTYSNAFADQVDVRVLEIGSQDVNGSLRTTCPGGFQYTGVDFQEAKGVDIVLKDPYSLPFDDASVDIVLSSSCFEHSEMFWLVFLEILRVLKPHGLFYLNAPSAGSFHRYPVDCWRFYPDSAMALISWARRNGIHATMLESYTQKGGTWQDYVAVFLKDAKLANQFPNRIIDGKKDFENGQVLSDDQIHNLSYVCQNDKKLQVIEQIVGERIIVS
jgi:SAM-dependent methyltransferase